MQEMVELKPQIDELHTLNFEIQFMHQLHGVGVMALMGVVFKS